MNLSCPSSLLRELNGIFCPLKARISWYNLSSENVSITFFSVGDRSSSKGRMAVKLITSTTLRSKAKVVGSKAKLLLAWHCEGRSIIPTPISTGIVRVPVGQMIVREKASEVAYSHELGVRVIRGCLSLGPTCFSHEVAIFNPVKNAYSHVGAELQSSGRGMSQ